MRGVAPRCECFQAMIRDRIQSRVAFDALIKYREWYGCAEGQANVGLKLTAEEVGRGIVQREDDFERVTEGVLDRAAFAQDGGPSIAERIYFGSGSKVRFRHADNKRTATAGAMGGWDQLRARLRGDGDGRPMLYLFSTCTHTIRTLPLQQHDPARPEDLDSDGEDHAADETRYACMSRPYVYTPPSRTPSKWQKGLHEATADELFNLDGSRRVERTERI